MPGESIIMTRKAREVKEHLFADIFDSDVLSYQQRELVTIAALAAMPGVGAQFQSHIGMGMNTGITADQIQEVLDIIEEAVSKEQAEAGRTILLKANR